MDCDLIDELRELRKKLARLNRDLEAILFLVRIGFFEDVKEYDRMARDAVQTIEVIRAIRVQLTKERKDARDS